MTLLDERPTWRILRPIPYLCFAFLITLAGSTTFADRFDQYARRPDLDFRLPDVLSALQGGAVMDDLADGRLVIATTREIKTDFGFTTDGVEVRVETLPGSRDFRYLGDLPLNPDDPAWYSPGGFLTVGRTDVGTVRVAIGNANASVGVFDAAELVIPALEPPAGTTAPITITWFDSTPISTPFADFVATATWTSADELAVGSGFFNGPSQVNLLDVTRPPSALSAPLLVKGITGSNGGIALDAGGNLFVGDGSRANVGLIKRFDAADWQSGLQNSEFQDFVEDGTEVTQLLSAASLQFDGDGILLVGGGDFAETGTRQIGFFALHDLSGLGRPDRQFDPDTVASRNFYSLLSHEISGQIFAWDNFGSDRQQVYVLGLPVVPEPGSLLLTAFALLYGVVGTGPVARRRRLRR